MADDELCLVRDFALRVRSGDAEVEAGRGPRRVRLEGLFELLAAFERPSSRARVLDGLVVRGTLDWAERAATLLELEAAGVIAHPDAADPLRRGFASPAIQADMLHDDARVAAYLAAIAEVVRPGDVVIDLGTGTGILAVAAARAGARHVYAIEESAIADVAAQVFEDNGVADRVTLLRGHSTQLTLPERASVLVTETLGNDPLDEGILVYLEDARRRLLTQDARLIPSKLTLVVQALEVPLDRTPLLTEETTARWHQRYGIDLGAFQRQHRAAATRFTDHASVLSRLPRLSAPLAVDELLLDEEIAAKAEGSGELVMSAAAGHVGVALGYDAALSPATTLSVGAHADVPCPSWRYPIFTRLSPMPRARGELLRFRFARDRTACTLAIDEPADAP
jgi:hypothetical protein